MGRGEVAVASPQQNEPPHLMKVGGEDGTPGDDAAGCRGQCRRVQGTIQQGVSPHTPCFVRRCSRVCGRVPAVVLLSTSCGTRLDMRTRLRKDAVEIAKRLREDCEKIAGRYGGE